MDATYTTPAEHNNPMEPHATIAAWENGALTLHDSNQGAWRVAQDVAGVFGLEPSQVRVIAPHVGGGFGSKGTPRPHVIVAAMCAQHVERPVKLALTRQQMFTLTGYRTPTIQRIQLGADHEGRLSAIAHDVLEQTSTVQEFAEQTAVVTRMMYASPNRRTTHRLVALDVPTPSWMRAPGECPGMFALESAVDELAIACDVDPVELRIRNEPEIDPESGNRFSTRNLVSCLREGAERFGWADRDPRPASRQEGRWMAGMGVAVIHVPGPARRVDGTRAGRGRRDIHHPCHRRRHRHGRAHGSDADRGRHPRGSDRPRACRDRRQRVGPGNARRGLDGHLVMGYRRRAGVPSSCGRARPR